jgi:hypothetical protein
VSPDSLLGTVATFGKVTVQGWGFDSASKVNYGGVPALLTTFVDQSILESVPPLGLFGIVDVTVTNRWGESSLPVGESRFAY